MKLKPEDILPRDAADAVLVGRVQRLDGPHVCVLRDWALIDLSLLAPTMSDLFDLDDIARRVRGHGGPVLCSLGEALENRKAAQSLRRPGG